MLTRRSSGQTHLLRPSPVRASYCSHTYPVRTYSYSAQKKHAALTRGRPDGPRAGWASGQERDAPCGRFR